MTVPLPPDPSSSDFYARLGVTHTADAGVIKAAYLALVRLYTPERAPETFKRIREAYETLTNPTTRAQYDARPDPWVISLLDQASQAMKLEDYSRAEQAYKQVLIAVPGLSWVRNMLGLCFIYQGQPDQAIAQYQRLTREPTADASIHGNAAHAYRAARRFAESENEFKIAMRLAGDQADEYGLALIQMWLEGGFIDKADEFAATRLKASPTGSPSALEYAGRRIEIALLAGKKAKVPMLVDQITKSVTTDDQRKYAAFVLGKSASRLIANDLFELANQIAKVARKLQPDDPDYDGQDTVSQLLAANDFIGARRLLNTHVAFAADGWLRPLKASIEKYCVSHAALQGMRRIDSPPSLSTVNGIGTTLLGHRDDDPVTGTYVATQYFVVLFVPLFPLTSYRVRPAATGGWHFLGKVPHSKAQKAHLVVFAILMIAWLTYSNAGPQTFDSAPTSALTERSSGSAEVPAPAAQVQPRFPLHGALSVYEGDVTNTTENIAGRLRFEFDAWEGDPAGILQIESLGGSGPFYLQARPDTAKLISVSSTGDTILWVGKRRPGELVGRYFILGGASKHEEGVWDVKLSSGAPIPDSIDIR